MRIRPSGPDFGVIAASENTGIPAPESIAARRCGLRARIVKSKSTSRPALGDRQFLPAVPSGSLSRFVAPAILPPRTSPSTAMPGAMRKPAEEAGIHRIKFHAMYRKKSRTVATISPTQTMPWRPVSCLRRDAGEFLHEIRERRDCGISPRPRGSNGGPPAQAGQPPARPVRLRPQAGPAAPPEGGPHSKSRPIPCVRRAWC